MLTPAGFAGTPRMEFPKALFFSLRAVRRQKGGEQASVSLRYNLLLFNV
jgi:hypothetical protein